MNREISQRMLEAAAAHREVMADVRRGTYRAPARADVAIRAKRDTTHGPVRSVSVDEYLADLAAR